MFWNSIYAGQQLSIEKKKTQSFKLYKEISDDSDDIVYKRGYVMATGSDMSAEVRCHIRVT